MKIFILFFFSAASLLLVCAAYFSLPDFWFGAFVFHLVVWAQLTYLMRDLIFRAVGSYARSTIVTFGYLFVLVAPSFQLMSNNSFHVNTLVYSQESVLSSNIQFACMFLGVVVGFRWLIPKVEKNVSDPLLFSHQRSSIDFNRQTIIGIAYVLISFLALLLTYSIATTVFDDRQNEFIETVVSPWYLVQTKVLGFLPIPILFSILRIRRGSFLKNPLWIFVLIVVFLGVLMSQNPLLEKRQSIGPVYLAIIAYAFFDKIRSGFSRFLLIFMSTVVVMPIFSLLTHVNYQSWDFSEVELGLVFEHFLEIHYDAWANAAAASEMVDRQGFYFGKQLLGDILFWVPRSVWEQKPQMSGFEIAQFLINNYAMWFENISAPLATEGYIDFGYSGSFFYGLILAYFVGWIERNSMSFHDKNAGMALFLSFFLMFVLRGALMNAVAYGIANCIAFLLVRQLERVVAGKSEIVK